MALTRRSFVAQWVEMNSNGAFLYFYEFISTSSELPNKRANITLKIAKKKSHLLKEKLKV